MLYSTLFYKCSVAGYDRNYIINSQLCHNFGNQCCWKVWSQFFSTSLQASPHTGPSRFGVASAWICWNRKTQHPSINVTEPVATCLWQLPLTSVYYIFRDSHHTTNRNKTLRTILWSLKHRMQPKSLASCNGIEVPAVIPCLRHSRLAIAFEESTLVLIQK